MQCNTLNMIKTDRKHWHHHICCYMFYSNGNSNSNGTGTGTGIHTTNIIYEYISILHFARNHQLNVECWMWMCTGANASQRRRNNNISIFNFNKSIIINNWIRWVCNQEETALYLSTIVGMILYTNRALYTLVSEFNMYVQQCLMHGKRNGSSDEVMRERKWM